MKEKKERRKWGLIILMVFIMIGTSFSFVFFGFAPPSDKVDYNGISFTNSRNAWIAKINGQDAAFSFLPGDVERITVLNDSIKKLQGKFEIDATYDFNSTYKESIDIAQYQMGLTLSAYNIYLRRGFTTNNPYKIPVITCHDATQNVPVVYFRFGNITNTHTDGNCIIVEASTNLDFIKVKDRMVYGILGVIK